MSLSETDIAYIAGLFDGEGSITYKKYNERKKKGNQVKYYNCWRISMEIAMTDKSVLVWLHEVLGCGTLNKKPRKNGHKMQWRWRCVFRDAYYVCTLLWPHAHVKLPKIQKVIDHYTEVRMNEKIVNIDEYRQNFNME
jgi:hypothetical protein